MIRIFIVVFTDNSVETVDFGKTDIPHPSNHNVSQQSVAGSSTIKIFFSVYANILKGIAEWVQGNKKPASFRMVGFCKQRPIWWWWYGRSN